jgi:hypothetical protein
MSKRSFAGLVAAVVLVVPATDSQAQIQAFAVDGCAKLARVVYSEVSTAALYGPSRSGPWTIDLGRGDLEVCDHTAKTVTRAFTSAMQSAGVTVSWGPDRNRNGDFCWSGFISQCYPSRDRVAYSSIGSDAEFVSRAWATVSQAVMREMYNPFSSDEIRFRDDDLKLRLGLALRSIRSADDY